MDYAASRKAGYPTGSGTIASRCKVVVQERMAQAGMRRNRPGAQAMLVLYPPTQMAKRLLAQAQTVAEGGIHFVHLGLIYIPNGANTILTARRKQP